MAQTLKDIFANHRISIFGDSISTFEGMIPAENAWYYGDSAAEIAQRTKVRSPKDTWWVQAIEALGGTLLTNASYSGSMVAGAGFPAGCSKERAHQIIGADDTTPDDILIFIGINDYGWGSAEAQAAGRSSATPLCVDLAKVPESEPGLAPEDALSQFQTAYDTMLGNLKTAAPQARIWCTTLLPGRFGAQPNNTFCYSLRGLSLDDYNDAIRCAAAAQGCMVADIRAEGFDYESADGTHPTAVGMAQLATLLLRSMERAAVAAELLSPSEAQPEEDARALSVSFLPYLASRRTCELPNCIGCPNAQGTGSQWSCVCKRDMIED